MGYARVELELETADEEQVYMLFLEPVTGSFATYAHKYISPLAGYLTAWCYWFLWVTVGMSEVTAIGIYVKYWFSMIPQWLPALAGVVIVASANRSHICNIGHLPVEPSWYNRQSFCHDFCQNRNHVRCRYYKLRCLNSGYVRLQQWHLQCRKNALYVS